VGSATALSTGKTVASGALSPAWFLAAGGHALAVPKRVAVLADVAGSAGGTTVAIVPFRLIPTGSPRFTIPVSVAVLAPVARSTFGA